ncbi:hypothetical protein DNHGIG_34830 [Collibacillus ludicampi]|uniref:DUF1453 domain-containing protein n=1 Tax=Collibacillus ludicampi TaxID=2771369 RepID=A0AAV4LKI3_9BACL|nr:hypothetical protein [Collibacillus ludicampi]GIM47934.1 hypothetical protein DNHGIG_34830 [Collibacillus ludicampi]
MHHITPIFIVLLVLFSMVRRTRRTIGFQKFVKGRMFTRMTLLSIVGVIFLVMGYLNPMAYFYDAIGIVLGGVMAFYAIRTTSFEWCKDAWFYRPNPWIGVLLLVLFVGRIADRVYQDYALLGTSASANRQFAEQAQLATYSHDPITTIILFTMITYYVIYYMFLIRKERYLETEGQGKEGK